MLKKEAIRKTIALNISHHGGLIALAAYPGSATKLGIDIVNIN